MIAVKGNRTYQIGPGEVEARRRDGYDIYDGNGKLVAYNSRKTVPYTKYDELLKANEQLARENAVLKAQLAAVTVEAPAAEAPAGKKQTAKKV